MAKPAILNGDSGNDTLAGGSGSGIDTGDSITDSTALITETLSLVFTNGAFVVNL